MFLEPGLVCKKLRLFLQCGERHGQILQEQLPYFFFFLRCNAVGLLRFGLPGSDGAHRDLVVLGDLLGHLPGQECREYLRFDLGVVCSPCRHGYNVAPPKRRKKVNEPTLAHETSPNAKVPHGNMQRSYHPLAGPASPLFVYS